METVEGKGPCGLCWAGRVLSLAREILIPLGPDPVSGLSVALLRAQKWVGRGSLSLWSFRQCSSRTVVWGRMEGTRSQKLEQAKT